MFEKIKDSYFKWTIKKMYEEEYTKYKITVICKNPEDTFDFTFDDYCWFDKHEVLNRKVIGDNRQIKGIPLNNIRKFEIEVIDSVILYKKPLISDITPSFMAKEEIEEFNNSRERRIYLYKKYKK